MPVVFTDEKEGLKQFLPKQQVPFQNGRVLVYDVQY